MLPKKPLQVDDFSGGITDNILQGDPRRYAIADNFLITADKKLVQRDGYKTPDSNINYRPNNDIRVNGLFTIANESLLLFQSNRKMFLTNGNPGSSWDVVQGIDGNLAMQGGGELSQTSISEFQKQVYMTSDDGILPSKMYRDANGDWVARTVGLPKTQNINPQSEASLLIACIALANDLRTQLINHMMDYRFSVYTNQITASFYGQGSFNLHANRDKYSLSYLQAETFVAGTDPEVPPVIPTPAPAATDQASLFTLVAALNNAYEHHTHDATVGTMAENPLATVQTNGIFRVPLYHNGNRNFILSNTPQTLKTICGPLLDVDDDSTPTSLVQVAAQLDDLAQKYYFHQYAVNAHSFSNDFSFMNKYNRTVEKIGKVYSTTDENQELILSQYAPPTITPDYSDLFNYVNNLKSIYTSHITNVYSTHTQIATPYGSTLFDDSWTVTLPDATDLDSMYLLIFWLRSQYFKHNADALNYPALFFPPLNTYYNWGGTADYTNGSANLSDVKGFDGVPVTLQVGAWIYAGVGMTILANSTTSTTGNFAAKVISSGSGTATLDRPALQTQGDTYIAVSGAKYHPYFTNGVPQSSQVRVSSASNDLPSEPITTAPTIAGWIDLANELFNSMMSHTHDINIHAIASSAIASLANSTYFYTIPQKPFFIPEVETVSYAFYYSDAYKVEAGGVDYLTQGSPVYTEAIEMCPIYPAGTVIESVNVDYYPNATYQTSKANVITDIPVLTNSSDTNYDSDVQINIYKTAGNGSVYYKVDTIANGITTYTDYSSDDYKVGGKPALTLRQQLYTTGGVLGHDQIEKAKFVHIVNGTAYYAGIEDTNQFFPNRLRQSVQFAPDACPATFYDDFDDEITGLSSARSNLIVFCKNSIFREAGGFSSTGQGALTHEKISDIVGCLNYKSIVQTEIGIFFAGTDGFYYTDGYQVIKVSLEIDKTYASLTASDAQKRSIYGTYDKLNRRIWWAMKENPGDAENSLFLVFHVNLGVKPSGAFTKVFNKTTIFPASTVFWKGDHWFGHQRGYLFKSDKWQQGDQVPNYNILKADWPFPGGWTISHIPFNYTSCALDAGTIFQRKYLTKFHFVGDNTGNMSIQPYVIRDMNADDKGIKPLAPINYTANAIWGTPVCVWGDENQYWNNTGKADVMRRFPRTSLRSDFFQISLQPAKVGIYASEDRKYFPEFTYVEVSPSGEIMTLMTDDGSAPYDLTFNPDCYTVSPDGLMGVEGYVIALDFDDYTTEFPIAFVNGNVLSYSDPNLEMPPIEQAHYKFVIRGKRKRQKPTITSYVVHFAELGDKVEKYPGAGVNSGPGNAGENG